jgi:hypothetical protein
MVRFEILDEVPAHVNHFRLFEEWASLAAFEAHNRARIRRLIARRSCLVGDALRPAHLQSRELTASRLWRATRVSLVTLACEIGGTHAFHIFGRSRWRRL